MTYSVGMCTYNGVKYVAEQLNSILAQTVLPDEIVISDDGSADDTIAIMESILSQSSVPYHIYTDNTDHGVVGNFWHVFSKCTGDVIFSCDQDDVWLPNKAETVLRIFEKNKGALLVFSNGTIVDAELNAMGDIWNNLNFSPNMIKENDWATFLLKKNVVAGTTMAFKKELFDGHDEVPILILHDAFLAIKAALKHGIYCCEEQLILYRQHINNVVGLKRRSFANQVFAYFSNFRGMRTVREKYLLKSQQMYASFYGSENQKTNAFLDRNLAFWSDMVRAQESSIVKRLHICHQHWKAGEYYEFWLGARGYYRDLILAFIDWTEKKGEK